MTAIRSAGDAVLVDLVALSSPYTVDAIGDAVEHADGARAGERGQHLATLRTTYGIGVQMTSQSRLELPGTGLVTLARGRGSGRRPSAPEPRVRARSRDVHLDRAGVAGSAGPTRRDGT